MSKRKVSPPVAVDDPVVALATTIRNDLTKAVYLPIAMAPDTAYQLAVRLLEVFDEPDVDPIAIAKELISDMGLLEYVVKQVEDQKRVDAGMFKHVFSNPQAAYMAEVLAQDIMDESASKVKPLQNKVSIEGIQALQLMPTDFKDAVEVSPKLWGEDGFVCSPDAGAAFLSPDAADVDVTTATALATMHIVDARFLGSEKKSNQEYRFVIDDWIDFTVIDANGVSWPLRGNICDGCQEQYTGVWGTIHRRDTGARVVELYGRGAGEDNVTAVYWIPALIASFAEHPDAVTVTAKVEEWSSRFMTNEDDVPQLVHIVLAAAKMIHRPNRQFE